MIQRIQTVYLVLGALAVGAVLLFDALWNGAAATHFSWFVPVVAGLCGLTAIGALGTVFLYQNRRRQRSIVGGLQVLAALVTVVLFVGFYASDALSLRTADGAFATGKAVVLMLPVLTYLFFFLARRAIQGDIELVRSMDRLR